MTETEQAVLEYLENRNGRGAMVVRLKGHKNKAIHNALQSLKDKGLIYWSTHLANTGWVACEEE